MYGFLSSGEMANFTRTADIQWQGSSSDSLLLIMGLRPTFEGEPLEASKKPKRAVEVKSALGGEKTIGQSSSMREAWRWGSTPPHLFLSFNNT